MGEGDNERGRFPPSSPGLVPHMWMPPVGFPWVWQPVTLGKWWLSGHRGKPMLAAISTLIPSNTSTKDVNRLRRVDGVTSLFLLLPGSCRGSQVCSLVKQFWSQLHQVPIPLGLLPCSMTLKKSSSG